MSSLAVVRHLLLRLSSDLAPRKETLISGLVRALEDKRDGVKVALLQTIAAAAPVRFLDCTGSSDLFAFVVQNCSLPTEVGTAARQTLLAAARCGGSVDLWPAILEPLVTVQGAAYLEDLCRGISSTIADRFESNAVVGISDSPSAPRPAALLARLMVLTAAFDSRTTTIVLCFKLLGPFLHPSLLTVLPPRLDQLLEALSQRGALDQKKWGDAVFRLCSEIVDEIQTADVRTELLAALSSQVFGEDVVAGRGSGKGLYGDDSVCFNFSLKCVPGSFPN